MKKKTTKQNETNKEIENLNQTITPDNIYDHESCENIDNKLRDLIIEKGQLEKKNIILPKDKIVGISLRHTMLENCLMKKNMIEELKYKNLINIFTSQENKKNKF